VNLTWLQGLFLGLVQGLTEFLPISSSGHLVLAEEVVGFHPPGLYVEVGLHVATLLSVFIE
jgi:undecaprenyl-diphosphatase